MSVALPRSVWRPRYGRGTLDPGAEPFLILHHSVRPALGPAATAKEEIAAIQSVERHHVETNGWEGIGYNFLVSPSGRIYEGRGWGYRGAHAGDANKNSIGVCLLIDGTTAPPYATMITAVRSLIREGLDMKELAPNYVVAGHRDFMSTTCPGDLVYAKLQQFRHNAGTPIHLVRIETPRREHVEEILRLRQVPASAARPGIVATEILLRGIQAAEAGDRRAVIKEAADALSEWIRAG